MVQPVSRGIARVLREARRDPEFRAAVIARRSDAAHDRGLVLSPSERAILDGVDATLLESMIASLPESPREEDDLTSVPVTGVRPDMPPDPVRGTRPGLPIVLAAGAVLAGGVVAAGVCVTAGIRPDVPPPGVVAPPHPDEPAGTPPPLPSAPLIDSPDIARRLARAIASDIRLYHEQDARRAAGGPTPPALQAAIDEGRSLFLEKTAATIADREGIYRQAIDDLVLQRRP